MNETIVLWDTQPPALVNYLHGLIRSDVSTNTTDLPDGTRLSEILIYPMDRNAFQFLLNVNSVVLEYKKKETV